MCDSLRKHSFLTFTSPFAAGDVWRNGCFRRLDVWRGWVLALLFKALLLLLSIVWWPVPRRAGSTVSSSLEKCNPKLLKDSTSSNQMSPSPKYIIFLTFSVRRKPKSGFCWLQRLRVRKIMVPCFLSDEESKPEPPSEMFLFAQRFEVFWIRRQNSSQSLNGYLPTTDSYSFMLL